MKFLSIHWHALIKPRIICGALSAHERNRTFTPLRMADFESAASTSSATWAFAKIGMQYYGFFPLSAANIFSYSNNLLPAALLLWK